MQQIPKNLFIIVFVSLLLHLGGLTFVLVKSGTQTLIYGDAQGYVELAKNMKSGIGFSRLVGDQYEKEVFRTPGLPLLLYPFASSTTGIIIYLYLLTIL